ncbi:hypothetical protein CDAR_52321 [Caerostris darwini]|uniref:Uncharacterized protein n=1 Tax=Caerostris darwini TaxID=1538125 RepID=A0AAV4V2W6_9ARAC|nr:hypothetical protein CDAR_52321 [Caerostris darwini]
MEARHVAFQRISAFAGITRRLCQGSNQIRGLCILQTLRLAYFINKTLFIGNVRAHGFLNKFGELKYFVTCTEMRELIKVLPSGAIRREMRAIKSIARIFAV